MGAKLHWSKEMTAEKNSNLQEQEENQKLKKGRLIEQTLEIYIFFSLLSTLKIT